MLVNLDWLSLVVIGLASYRLSLMIASETGPFAVFERIRLFVTAKFPDKPIVPDAVYYRQHWVAEGFNCPLCVGFWLTPLIALSWFAGLWLVQFLILWLALAGLQTFLTKVSG